MLRVIHLPVLVAVFLSCNYMQSMETGDKYLNKRSFSELELTEIQQPKKVSKKFTFKISQNNPKIEKNERLKSETKQEAQWEEEDWAKVNQDIQEYEDAYNRAPDEIKVIVQWILGKHPLGKNNKYFVLYGKGAAKSTLATAIARKLNRKFIFQSALSLQGQYRYQTCENLQALFDRLTPGTVLILDEIEAIVDSHYHADAYITAQLLCGLLDEYERKKNFLCICTASVLRNMPCRLQSRLEGVTFEVENPSIESRGCMIQSYINKFSDHIISQGIDETYLQQFAEKTQNYDLNRIKRLIQSAVCISKGSDLNSKKVVLSPKFIEEALAALQAELEKFNKEQRPRQLLDQIQILEFKEKTI